MYALARGRPLLEASTAAGSLVLPSEARTSVLIAAAVPVLFARFTSRQDESLSNKVIAALRKEFGGHATRALGALK